MKTIKMFTLFVLLLSIFFSSVCYAGCDISNWDDSRENRHRPEECYTPSTDKDYKINLLLNKYPYIGYRMGGSDNFFLDTSSCNYYIDGGKAYVSCVIYCAGGAILRDSQFPQFIFKFTTYKQNNKRVVIFENATLEKETNEVSKDFATYDKGFLLNLFYHAAEESGLSKYLD